MEVNRLVLEPDRELFEEPLQALSVVPVARFDLVTPLEMGRLGGSRQDVSRIGAVLLRTGTWSSAEAQEHKYHPEEQGAAAVFCARACARMTQCHDQHYLSLALERQKRLPGARAALLKVVELSPKFAQAYTALARVYSAQGDQPLAEEALAKAAEVDPSLKK